tara:strand:- start:415 stop:1677 length:1263 start_codon:yes stop_codon:yes gene_type:complete
MQNFSVPKIFQPLWKPARYKFSHGGRGSGKSHDAATRAVIMAANQPGTRIVCVREVQKTLQESAKKLLEDMIVKLGLSSKFKIMNSEIRTPGGGVIMFQGLQDYTAESIKSLESINICWIEEAQNLSVRSLELLRPTIRAKDSEIWATWNPRNKSDPIDLLARGVESPPNAIIVEANYYDNPFFPAELESEREFDQRTDVGRYSHTWLGHFEPEAIGAIFSRQNIHMNRMAEMPCERERTLVGVDPAVTNTATSDFHGVSVCCKGSDGRGYVLADGSTKGSPHKWATRAIALFDQYDADAIVVEINQGGDMVKHTLQTIRPTIPVIEVRATRGKHVRAEPISSLYSLDMISHLGTFSDMEDQLCKFTSEGYDGEDSPDRAEAAIWAFTELFPELLMGKSHEALAEDYGQYGSGSGGAWMS